MCLVLEMALLKNYWTQNKRSILNADEIPMENKTDQTDIRKYFAAGTG